MSLLPATGLPADLRWRPIGPDVVPAWAALHTALRAAGSGDEPLGEADLADEVAAPWLDPDRDSVIGLDGDGVARAFGVVDLNPGDTGLLRVRAWGGVHPETRGRGIGRALLGWQERRAREVTAARRSELGAPVPGVLQVDVGEHDDPTGRLVARLGFAAARWFSVMRRSLALPVPDAAQVPVPPGVRLVPFTPALDEPVRHAHNEAFTDHFRFEPWTVETWRHHLTGHRDFRPDWSLVAFDGDQVAGYTLAAGYTEQWQLQGWTMGWTSLIGVLRPWRGRGLARALLAASMREFAVAGLEYAGLAVDAQNPTGAVQLYTGLGYEVFERTATWDKAV